MNNIDTNLSELLDIEPINPERLPKEISKEFQIELHKESTEDIQPSLYSITEDTEYARENIKNLIDNGTSALSELLKVASASEKARDYEVVSTMLKTIADMNKDLLELQKKKKDVLPSSKEYSKQNINVDKAVVFTGSTAELIKLIKQNKEE